MTVGDNGVGIPETVDMMNAPSLGFQLVKALVDQLDGEIQFKNSVGSHFTIKFPSGIVM